MKNGLSPLLKRIRHSIPNEVELGEGETHFCRGSYNTQAETLKVLPLLTKLTLHNKMGSTSLFSES